jgi:hypothetical protein
MRNCRKISRREELLRKEVEQKKSRGRQSREE